MSMLNIKQFHLALKMNHCIFHLILVKLLYQMNKNMRMYKNKTV